MAGIARRLYDDRADIELSAAGGQNYLKSRFNSAFKFIEYIHLGLRIPALQAQVGAA
jgi:hypothetical protein